MSDRFEELARAHYGRYGNSAPSETRTTALAILLRRVAEEERAAEREAFRESLRYHTYQCSECKDTTVLRLDMEVRARSGDAHALKWVAEVCGAERAAAIRSTHGAGEG